MIDRICWLLTAIVAVATVLFFLEPYDGFHPGYISMPLSLGVCIFCLWLNREIGKL